MDAPSERKNVKARRISGVVRPPRVVMPRPADTKSIHVWEKIRSRRLSRISASAPEGRARRKNGKVLAVCTIATINGDGARLVISQAAPTSCIHVPINETTLAIQRVLKNACLRGLQVVEPDWDSSFNMGHIIAVCG